MYSLVSLGKGAYPTLTRGGKPKKELKEGEKGSTEGKTMRNLRIDHSQKTSPEGDPGNRPGVQK